MNHQLNYSKYTRFSVSLGLAYPLPTKSRNASNFPSNAAHRTGVIPSGSLQFTSRRFASLRTSRSPSLAALQNKRKLLDYLKVIKLDS